MSGVPRAVADAAVARARVEREKEERAIKQEMDGWEQSLIQKHISQKRAALEGKQEAAWNEANDLEVEASGLVERREEEAKHRLYNHHWISMRA